MAARKQKPETKRALPVPAGADPGAAALTDALSRAMERSSRTWEEVGEITVTVRPSAEAKKVAAQSEEDGAWSLVETFDGRLTEAEKRINRVLARLGVE